MIKSLKDYKNLKKVQIIAKDLEQINGLLTTINTMLNPFKKYIPVMEVLSTVSNSKTIIEININKYKRLKNDL